MERCSGRLLELPDTRWKPVIYYETQCEKPVSRLGLCKSCLKHYENSSRKWFGRITDTPKQGYPMAGFRKCKWIGDAPVTTTPQTAVETPVTELPVVEPSVTAPVTEPQVTEPAVTEPAVTEPTVVEQRVDCSPVADAPRDTLPSLYTYIAVGAAAAFYAYIIYRCIESPPLFPKWSWYQHIFPLA